MGGRVDSWGTSENRIGIADPYGTKGRTKIELKK